MRQLVFTLHGDNMAQIELETTKEFKRRLKTLSREELLEFISQQTPKYIKQINRIEWVFKNKLKHLNWDDGSPVLERNLTNEELCHLIDPPFIFDQKMAKKWGFTEEQQRQIHLASDPVIWSKNMLGLEPRVYQTLVLRDDNVSRVMRFGRRMGKTYCMSIYLLWYSYIHTNGKSIVLAPMKSQVGVIYEAILEMAEKNSLVKESIVRSVASPQYEINFSNGSSIRLFTTGMKSNSKADVVRGQEAHVIILDEMDYMGKEDLVAVLPMLQKTSEDQEDKVLIAASTPTGQRNMFWDWNHDPNFSSFWYPTYCNPVWEQKEEDRLRSSTTKIAFQHEYEADWGEDADGVYPRRLVDLAFSDENNWDYKADIGHPGSKYVIGIDWDKYGAGVNIVVLEIMTEEHPDPRMKGKIRLCYREEILKEEFLLHKAVDRVVQLNSIFRPKHIYADRGYGEMQMEHIHLYGKEHPESNLQHVAKAWAFNEVIEVPDPYTHQKVKKDLKPFMVDNLRYMLEQNRIMFSAFDEDLYLQLISYIVIRTSITNRPVFGPGGSAPDHAHDALLLAAFAITYNYDTLINPDYAVKSVSVSNDTFLNMFTITSGTEEQIAEKIWDNTGSAPLYARRALTYGGNRTSKSAVKRKMF